MAIRKFALALGLTIAVAGCGGGGGGGAHPVSEAGVIQGSSEAASGSTAVYTEHGVSHAATPGDSIAGFGTARLLTLPNTGAVAAHANAVTSVSAAIVTTSLSDVSERRRRQRRCRRPGKRYRGGLQLRLRPGLPVQAVNAGGDSAL